MLPGRVRIALGVAERVVLAVEDRVRARIEVRAALHQEGEEMKHPLPARTQGVHLVGSVAMLEQALEQHAQEPVGSEEDVDQQILRSGLYR